MKKLLEVLQAKGIAEICRRLGLEFPEIFPLVGDLEENPYRDFIWIVKENQDFLVINAIPEREDQDHLFWEEWYSHKGEVHHHVLTLWQPQSFQEIFHAPESDDIHPEQCFSRSWYVIEDSDMRAMLLRR